MVSKQFPPHELDKLIAVCVRYGTEYVLDKCLHYPHLPLDELTLLIEEDYDGTR